MNEILTELSTYGYIILFLYSLGGGFFALVAAGVLSVSGSMDLGLSMFVAFLGNFLGDNLLFYLTKNYKNDFAKQIKKHRRKLAYSQILMKRFGSWIIIIQKFLYGFKTFVPIAIALTKYKFYKFALFNFFASIIWALSFGFLAFFGSKTIISAFNYLYQHQFLLPIFALILFAFVWIFFAIFTKKRKKI